MEEEQLHKIQLNHQIHKELTSVLANERTYAAWIRTGLTTFASGLVVAKFLHGTIPESIIIFIAISLFGVSAAFFAIAAWRYQHVGSNFLNTSRIAGTSLLVLTVISCLLVIAAFLSLFGFLHTEYLRLE